MPNSFTLIFLPLNCLVVHITTFCRGHLLLYTYFLFFFSKRERKKKRERRMFYVLSLSYFFLFATVWGQTCDPKNNNRGVSGDESSCCQCPRGKDYYASYHCDAEVPSRVINWPSPYDRDCKVPVVLECPGNYYTYKTLERSDNIEKDNAYPELVQEYVAALLNKASGYNVCDETTGPHGERLDSIITASETLIGEHCVAQTISKDLSIVDYNKARKNTFLLRGYNEGYFFAGPLCDRDGIGDITEGGEIKGVDKTCSSGCTMNAQYYYSINCESGGTIGQDNCIGNEETTTTKRRSNWPSTTISETTLICGSERYIDVLSASLNDVDNNDDDDDVWLDLASAYITTVLNREYNGGSCATSEVLQALKHASNLLNIQCPCKPGEAGCSHTVTPSKSEKGIAMSRGPLAVLEKYNSGIIGPGFCGVVFPHLENNDYNDDGDYSADLNTCCAHGCTHSAGYWVSHSCILPVLSGEVAPNARIPWPSTTGIVDKSCATFPNAESVSFTICGESKYGILVRSMTANSGDGDAWTNLAAQYIAATLNIANGACTDFYAALTSTSLSSFEGLLESTLKQLTDNCDSANNTHVSSELGISMYMKQLVLESFNEGDLGPGRCSPNDNGHCNINRKTLPLVSGRCYTAKAQQNNENCTLSEEHWKTHNYLADVPRNQAWPLIHRQYQCTPDTHKCTANDIQSLPEGHDPVGDAIADQLWVNPRVLGHFTNGKTGREEQLVQETATWCPLVIGQNYYHVNGRSKSTEMLRMLQNVDNQSKNGSLSTGQKKWVNVMNQLTTAVLNVRNIVSHSDKPAILVKTIFEEIKDVSSGTPIKDVLETLFVDDCLLWSCDAYPENAIPSFPDHRKSCSSNYDIFYRALESFNKGRFEHYPHCSYTEPPEVCTSGPYGSPCGCTRDSLYYITYHSGMSLMGLNAFEYEWPRVDPTMYPLEYLQQTAPPYTEKFRSLVCSSEGNWYRILEKAYYHTGQPDAYLTLMKTLITAWLNAFSSGCISADNLQVLQQASKYVSKRLTTGLCSGGGRHQPVDTNTLDGKIMISYADALSHYVSNDLNRCENKCVSPSGENLVSCGHHGTCSPVDGLCYCEPGWQGDRCEVRYCGGNGIDDGTGVCHCFQGYSGEECLSCGAPVSISGRSYICRPCPPDVCGFANGAEGIPLDNQLSKEGGGGGGGNPVVYILTHVPSSRMNDYLVGNVRFPQTDGLPLPQLPGTGPLDCKCKYVSEGDLRSSVFGSLLSSRDITLSKRRNGEGMTKQKRLSGNAYYDSRFRTAPGSFIIRERQEEFMNSPKAQPLVRVMSTRHETNISDPAYDDVIDAIDALFFSLIGSEELTELCANDCPEPDVTNSELKDEIDDDHDELTSFGIAIVALVAVVLLVVVLLGIILLLIWSGVTPRRSNPLYEYRAREGHSRRPRTRQKTVRFSEGSQRQGRGTISTTSVPYAVEVNFLENNNGSNSSSSDESSTSSSFERSKRRGRQKTINTPAGSITARGI